MTVFILQLIAMVAMFCDHFATGFLDELTILRCIGRFAFPIYALLLADTYRHIKDDPQRVDKHLKTYVLLAVISEVGYDLLEAIPLTFDNAMASQNCIITLFLAFLGLMAIDRWKEKPIYMWSAILLTAAANYLLKANYKFVGVLLVYAFYYYLNHFLDKKWIQRFLFLFLIFVCYIPLYHWARYDFCNLATYLEKMTVSNICWYITHIFVAVLLSLYNGKQGYKSKPYQNLYRSFYPVHLLLLGILRQIFLT